jgi:hypothetical protein
LCIVAKGEKVMDRFAFGDWRDAPQVAPSLKDVPLLELSFKSGINVLGAMLVLSPNAHRGDI